MKLIKNFKIKTDSGFEAAQMSADAIIYKEGEENISLSNKITDIENNHISLVTGKNFPSDSDLNTFLTPGNFRFTLNNFVSTLKNCPTSFPFKMVVGYNALYDNNKYDDDEEYFYQEIVDLRGCVYWRNYSTSKGWQDWILNLNDQHLPNISTGDLGEEAHLKNCELFMQRMKQKAEDIGLSANTIVNTPSGWCKKPVHAEENSESDTKYNSYITVEDALKLLIAARHTPEVYQSMNLAETYIHYDKQPKHIVHSIVGDTRDGQYSDGTKREAWRTWAEKNGYTILAAKGGSLGGTLGENGKSNGIVNMTMLLQSGEEVYAVAILNMEYANGDYHKEMRPLIQDLIEWINNGTESELISSAPGKGIALGGAKITSNGTFDEDIESINSSMCYKGRNTKRVAASVIKILTAITVVPYLEPAYTSTTYDDLVGGGVESDLAKVGTTLTMKDALAIMLMRSDNNMATMLARTCGGRMCEKELEIGSLETQIESLEELVKTINSRLIAAEQDINELMTEIR